MNIFATRERNDLTVKQGIPVSLFIFKSFDGTEMKPEYDDVWDRLGSLPSSLQLTGRGCILILWVGQSSAHSNIVI